MDCKEANSSRPIKQQGLCVGEWKDGDGRRGQGIAFKRAYQEGLLSHINYITFSHFLSCAQSFTTIKGGGIVRQALIMEILHNNIRIKEKSYGLCFSTCKGKVP